MIPVSAARSGTRGLPPFLLSRFLGNSGSITAHNTSETNTFMPGYYTTPARGL